MIIVPALGWTSDSAVHRSQRRRSLAFDPLMFGRCRAQGPDRVVEEPGQIGNGRVVQGGALKECRGHFTARLRKALLAPPLQDLRVPLSTRCCNMTCTS